jgi:hypothetical protein
MADSGDSSPNSAAATDDAHHDGSEPSAPPAHAPPSKVRLMVSYGGRIQPRPHDSQLAYVNGETKILSLDRPLRFADFAARLAALLPSGIGGFCAKYQLPGEDLDALVSLTNDEDLDHLVLEYDRLHLLRPASRGSTLRLRVFLFPVQSHPPPSGLLGLKPERHWFLEALNTVPQPKQETPAQGSSPPPQQQESVFTQQSSPPPQQKQGAGPVQQQAPPATVQEPAPPQPMLLAPVGPDSLFGLDNGFAPPPAVKVKDAAGDPPTGLDNAPVGMPAKNEDRSPNQPGDHVAVVSPVVSPGEYQRQIQELEKLQVADNASNQPQQAPAPAALQRNGSDDSLTRAHPPANAEYYVPKFPEKPPVPPPSPTPAPATAYLPMPGRYTSVAPGSGAEHAPIFFIPSPHGGYYATTAPPGANSYPAMYAVAPPSANGSAATTYAPPPAHRLGYDSSGMSNATAYAPPPAPHQVYYDSNGRAMYYASVLPQYAPAAANGMSGPGAALGTEPAKPTVS